MNHHSTIVSMENGASLARRLAVPALIVVLLHTALLFLVIPGLSGRLAPAYNQDQYADGYDMLAQNLATGHGYRFYPDTARTLMREPGYPALLALITLLFGSSFVLVKLANLIMALATAFLMVRIALRLPPAILPRSGLWLLVPPCIFLFHPATLVAESRGGIESLFTLLLVWFLLSAYTAVHSGRWQDYLATGLILGMTVLVRSTPLLFPGFLFVYALVRGGRRLPFATLVRKFAILVVATTAVLSPWIVRNFELTGKFVPTTSVFGVSAQAGQYINMHLFEGRPWWLLDREAGRTRDQIALSLGLPFEDGPQGYYQTFYRSGDEVKFSGYLAAQVKAEYRQSPLLFVRVLGQNFISFWVAGKTPSASIANAILQLPFVLLALAGALRCRGNKGCEILWIFLLFITYLMAVHMPILAQARYSVPLVPLVAFFATAALAGIHWLRAWVGAHPVHFAKPAVSSWIGTGQERL